MVYELLALFKLEAAAVTILGGNSIIKKQVPTKMETILKDI